MEDGSISPFDREKELARFAEWLRSQPPVDTKEALDDLVYKYCRLYPTADEKLSKAIANYTIARQRFGEDDPDRSP